MTKTPCFCCGESDHKAVYGPLWLCEECCRFEGYSKDWLVEASQANVSHCQTCKWWDDEPDPLCGEHNCCGRTASTDGSADIPGVLAFAADGEGYYAVLMTHATFGCVMWEAKERP